MNYQVNKDGYFGEFGGSFIPEMLYPNISQLQNSYLEIIESAEFKNDFKTLLEEYAGRPSPLSEAKRLSEKYGTTIFLKREDLNHTGSHKINNALGQILLARKLGRKRIIAETGAGQHGVATATVCALFGMECVVYMGEVDISRQAPNVERMRLLGATVRSVTSGSRTLKDATNEALRDWIANPVDTHYIIGSAVGPHPYPDMVARFQAIISEEMKFQLKKKIGKENPDYVIACIGGGSNAIGSFYHFLNDDVTKLIGAEAAGQGIETNFSAATINLGRTGVLHGSKTLLMQTADGQVLEAHSISAGLDYPGVGPQHADLFMKKRVSYLPVTDEQALEAALEVTKLEGILPALETAHAFALLPKLKFKKDESVVICLSGRGDKDLETYMNYRKKKEQGS